MKGVLIDIDGTLVLSNDAHAYAWAEAFDSFGYSLTFEQIRPLIGMGGDKLMPKLVPELNSEAGVGKKIGDYRTKLFLDKYAPELQPTPGSRELVERLLSHDLKLIVASSAKESELSALLKSAKVDDLLHEAATASDAEQSKPEPDIVQAALEKLGLPAAQTLMIGDTPYDLEAAAQTGVGLIAVRCGGWDDSQLAGALAIYDNPADLAANYASSPFVK